MGDELNKATLHIRLTASQPKQREGHKKKKKTTLIALVKLLFRRI